MRRKQPLSTIASASSRRTRAPVEAALARHRGHGLPHHRRVGHLHHLRRRLHLLPRQEPHRPHAAAMCLSCPSSPASACSPAASPSTSQCSALHEGKQSLCSLWLAATVLLGSIFIGGTAHEWYELITIDHLTISTNLFGTTFYSLVGLHATHVIVGLFMLSLALIFSLTGAMTSKHTEQAGSFVALLALRRRRLGGRLYRRLCPRQIAS